MDPKSSYLLNIKLLGNPKKARREFSAFCFEKVVDSDLINLKDFVESIVDEYPPGYKETVYVQYYDADLRTFPLVATDQELMAMFEKHSKTKLVHMFIAYRDPSESYHPITEWQGFDSNDPVQAPNRTQEQPKVSHPSSTQPDDESYLQNPQPDNEHVGVDEEAMYLNIEPVVALDVAVYCEKGKESEDKDEDEDVDENEDEEVLEEEDEVEADDEAPDVQYDKDDPPMSEGSTYPDMETFKLALCQYAIKREFEFNIEKSAPSRFRAYCSRKKEDKCPWRLHASTMEDMSTVTVIVLPNFCFIPFWFILCFLTKMPTI